VNPKTLSCVALLLTLAAGVGACGSGDRPDPNFDSRVARPAYAADGPLVLFDEAHHNHHRAGKSYRPFVRLIESDGYRVSRGSRRITAEGLERFSVLVVAAALGTNERNDDPAFEDSECDAIRDWVSAGGALLLITDHYPTGHAVESLAARFGVRLSKGVVEDSTQYDGTFDPTHLVYSRENGGLVEHPVIEGRDSSESIGRVLTFTGEAVYADPPAVGFLRLSRTAVARPAEPNVRRRGGDVIVEVAYGAPVEVPGWAQGVALDYGSGRVVVLGEAAMLSAQLHRFDRHAIGMNVPGYDNRQLALNIMHWLTRLL
jgi:hypothetical protein